MTNFYKPSDEAINWLKKRFPAGTRVRLISMDDPYTTLRCGDTGTVRSVDDMGTIHVNWDCGTRLGLVYPDDSFEVLNE